jgi:hypothetical protein
MEHAACRLGALVGPGRSGTTWAGTLVDSSPEVIYRFEPFRRLSSVKPVFRRWFDELKEGRFDASHLKDLYSQLRVAHPYTNKPPFFSEKSYRSFTLGRAPFWPAAKIAPPLARLYEAVYSPEAGPLIVFKEVTFIQPLRNLLASTPVPVVYLVRHPCATVLSEIKGQQHGMMPSGRQAHLGEILHKYSPELASKYQDVVRGSDVVKRIALLWRCEVEMCVPMVVRSARGMLMTYEQLATDTATQARRLLEHFGLDYSAQTEAYVNSLHALQAGATAVRRTGWGDRYFSVYRNPAGQHLAWKKTITAEQRKKIESGLDGCEVMEICAKLGQWS